MISCTSAVSRTTHKLLAVLAFGLVFMSVKAGAQTETILDDFLSVNGHFPNGLDPVGTLVFDGSGNLFGAANGGGDASASCPGNGPGCGLIFELTPNLSGGWTQTTLHRFTGNLDGGRPMAGVLLDSAGNVYGSTFWGGSANSGPGVIFKLTPIAGGGYQESIVHSFFGSNTGNHPTSLVFDSTGNLYGVTNNGGDPNSTNPDCQGALGCGLVFKLTPNVSGPWTETILHAFTGATDGAIPEGLTMDASGNLYGTTVAGGNPSCNCGVVYRLSPASSGGWRESVLHTFSKTDGAIPQAGVILDSAGNIYGTTSSGGGTSCFSNSGCGLVFELAKTTSGYSGSIIYSFTGGTDGFEPIGGLSLDTTGNLYGVAALGGNSSCGGGDGCGTLFKLAPQGGGVWTQSVLWTFQGTPSDGAEPLGTPILDGSGSLYGNTSVGGMDSGGVIYRVVP